MVARVRAVNRMLLAAACGTLVLGGCGGESSRDGGVGRNGGAGGAGAVAGTGGATFTDGEGGFVARAGAGPEATALDGAECATRRTADCAGIDRSEYYSGHGTFDASPELAACSAYVSFDGCGKLIYAFDDGGCATAVDPGAGGWKASGHLSLLRDCLNVAFTDARFPCLASRTFAFYESCLIP